MSNVWSSEEIEYLKENVGLVKVTTISRNLGRTYTSVILKLKRLGLNNTKQQNGMITMNELAEILGVDRNTVKGWVDRHHLRCTKKVTKKERKFTFIHTSDFWRWAEKNKDKVQFKNIEPNIIVPEPDWVDEERRKELCRGTDKKRPYKPWTTQENQEVVMLRKTGKTYKEIGERLGRSAVSVEKQYKRIIREKFNN